MKKDFQLMAVRTWHLQFRGNVVELSTKYIIEHWTTPEADKYLSLYRRVGVAAKTQQPSKRSLAF